MADQKNRRIVKAEGGSSPKAKKNVTGLRVGAIVLWVVAIVCEILSLAVITGGVSLPTPIPPLYKGIILLVVDLALIIIGSQLWKKANSYAPASEKNPVKFWLWNNMGLIACALAFVPFILLVLTNKNADKKTKTVATIAAVVALLAGGLASYDFNPISQEDLAKLESQKVYWTKGGGVFHTYEDCSSLNRSEELIEGNIDQAHEAKKERLCKICRKKSETAVSTTE